MLFAGIALLDPDGTWSQVTPQRDVLDRVWRVNRPAEIGADLDTIPSTMTQFDSLDRVLIATSPPDTHAFRIARWNIAVIVSEVMKDAMVRAGCKGATFRDVT